VQAPAEDAADALKQCDLLVAGVDQISARMWLNQFAVRHCIPYVDAGVVIDTEDEDTITAMEGYIQVIAPGATACFDCMDRGDPEQARIESLSDEALQEEVERGYIDETTLSPEPAVVPLNGVVASKTVQTVAKLVTGYDAPDGSVPLPNRLPAKPALLLISSWKTVMGSRAKTRPNPSFSYSRSYCTLR